MLLRGKRLVQNAGAQTRYAQALKKLVRKMVTETKEEFIALFKKEFSEQFFKAEDMTIASQARILVNKLTKKFTGLFETKASILAEGMLNGQEKLSRVTLKESLKDLKGQVSLRTSVISENLKEVSKALITENVNLITSIPEKYLSEVSGAVMRSITSGEGIKDLIPAINKYSGMTYRRVKNIALDQTRKAYNTINKEKMQSLGVTKFEWLHSAGGQKPRASHIKISGTVFSFENLKKEQAALGVPEQDRGIPGYPPNCRCVMGAVIDWE